METKTGIQLDISTVQGVHQLKNPDIYCDIDGTVHTLKFGKHNMELPAGEHALTIKIAPFMGQAIQDQIIRFAVQENALTCIHYKVDMFSKSSIKLDGIKEQKEKLPKKVKTIGIGRTLGRIVNTFKKK